MTLRQKILDRQFAVLGEFQPPKGADFSLLLEHANQVRGRVAAFVMPELAVAVLKASSLGGCAYLQNHGLETVFQVCTRDRNRLALQADILSSSALGVPNLMVVSGESVAHGDHIQAREVRDLDMVQLLEAISGLKSGKDMAGNHLTAPPNFFLGAEMNIGGDERDLTAELEALSRKIDFGVEFVVTSPVFDLRFLETLVKRIGNGRAAVIPTVLVLKSVGMARYVNQNVKNITVPQDIIRRMEKSTDRPREGLRIAGEMIRGLKEIGLAGVLVSTRGWEDRLPQILNEAGM